MTMHDPCILLAYLANDLECCSCIKMGRRREGTQEWRMEEKNGWAPSGTSTATYSRRRSNPSSSSSSRVASECSVVLDLSELACGGSQRSKYLRRRHPQVTEKSQQTALKGANLGTGSRTTGIEKIRGQLSGWVMGMSRASWRGRE